MSRCYYSTVYNQNMSSLGSRTNFMFQSPNHILLIHTLFLLHSGVPRGRSYGAGSRINFSRLNNTCRWWRRQWAIETWKLAIPRMCFASNCTKSCHTWQKFIRQTTLCTFKHVIFPPGIGAHCMQPHVFWHRSHHVAECSLRVHLSNFNPKLTLPIGSNLGSSWHKKTQLKPRPARAAGPILRLNATWWKLALLPLFPKNFALQVARAKPCSPQQACLKPNFGPSKHATSYTMLDPIRLKLGPSWVQVGASPQFGPKLAHIGSSPA